MMLTVLLALAAGPPGGHDCPCGPTCACAPCLCGPATAYERVRDMVAGGNKVVMVVKPKAGTPLPKAEAGWTVVRCEDAVYFKPGTYRCWLDEKKNKPLYLSEADWQARQIGTPRPFALRPAYPSTPATTAPTAGRPSTSSPAGMRTVPTRTFAPAVLQRGGTRGCST